MALDLLGGFCRVSVIPGLASEIRRKWSTATAVRGSHIRNAADGAIATTCTASRHARGRCEEPVPEALVVAPVHDAQDLADVEVNDGGSGLEPGP